MREAVAVGPTVAGLVAGTREAGTEPVPLIAETGATAAACAAGMVLTPSVGVAVIPGVAAIAVAGDEVVREDVPLPPDADAAGGGTLVAPVSAVVDEVPTDDAGVADVGVADVVGALEMPAAATPPVGVRICAAAGVPTTIETTNAISKARVMMTGNGGSCAAVPGVDYFDSSVTTPSHKAGGGAARKARARAASTCEGPSTAASASKRPAATANRPAR